jgi:hypothetical protein
LRDLGLFYLNGTLRLSEAEKQSQLINNYFKPMHYLAASGRGIIKRFLFNFDPWGEE